MSGFFCAISIEFPAIDVKKNLFYFKNLLYLSLIGNNLRFIYQEMT